MHSFRRTKCELCWRCFPCQPSFSEKCCEFSFVFFPFGSFKLRVPGGKVARCSRYAPHTANPLKKDTPFSWNPHRPWHVFLDMHGPLIAIGVFFNARLYKRFDSDFDFVGPSVFGHKNVENNLDCNSNRSLLLLKLQPWLLTTS